MQKNKIHDNSREIRGNSYFFILTRITTNWPQIIREYF